MTKLLILFTLSFAFLSTAQQEPFLTQFWNSYSFVNPATCAMDYKHQAAVQYRNQWDGVNGAPNSLLANYNYEINLNHAVGVNYSYETIGNSKYNIGVLNYNYRIHFSDSITHFLLIGAGIGMGNYSADFTNFVYPTTVDSDYGLPSKATTTYPKLNLGVAYRFKNLFVGIGSTQITDAFLSRNNSAFIYKPVRHYYLMAAYDFKIVENFSLKPQLLIQTDAINISTQVNLLATLFKNYSLGFTYRTSDAFAFIAQVDIVGKYRIGYSYDRTTNKLAGISKGTHEIVLGVLLNKKKVNGIACKIPRKHH